MPLPLAKLSSRVVDYVRQRYEVKRSYLSMLGSTACFLVAHFLSDKFV